MKNSAPTTSRSADVGGHADWTREQGNPYPRRAVDGPILRSLKAISRRIGLTPILKRILLRPRALHYDERLRNEQAFFAEFDDVHKLPEIYHYWSNKYLRPAFEEHGFSNPDQFFALELAKQFGTSNGEPKHFVSLGAGNCETEVHLAEMLRERGLDNFNIECLDINKVMLRRGLALAAEKGVAQHISVTLGDLNTWEARNRYDGVIANQSLHHVVALDHLFDTVKSGLHDDGIFVTSDMIGRNGHLRWPEALAIVQEFWAELPVEKRFNLQLLRQENEFIDWDCSREHFEGIRSQDILPALISRFEFRYFIAFSNVIDPFIDRSFGHHLDPNKAEDRDFIDRIHARDSAEIAARKITPTHMLAAMKKGVPGFCPAWTGRPPLDCVRRTK